MIICFFHVNKPIDLFFIIDIFISYHQYSMKKQKQTNVLYIESIKTSYFGDW